MFGRFYEMMAQSVNTNQLTNQILRSEEAVRNKIQQVESMIQRGIEDMQRRIEEVESKFFDRLKQHELSIRLYIDSEVSQVKKRQDFIFTKQDQIQSTLCGDSSMKVRHLQYFHGHHYQLHCSILGSITQCHQHPMHTRP